MNKNYIKLDWDALKKKYPTLQPKKDRGICIQGLGVNITQCILGNQLPSGQNPPIYNSLSIEEVSGRINDKFDMLGKEIRVAGLAINTTGGHVGASGAPITSPTE